MEDFRAYTPDVLPWTKAEKQVARQAFDAAYERECLTIRAKVKHMLEDGRDVRPIWRIHDYLTDQRYQTDRKYVDRYLRLINIFALLLREGWLTEADLNGLAEDKLERIKKCASC